MKKLKRVGTLSFLIMSVFLMFIVFACRQPQNNSNDKKTENVTITVKKGSHVKNAPENFTLEKGSKLGFTELKEKIKPLEFEANYILAKITLNNASGEEITDSSPYVFNENATIFISAMPKGATQNIELLELKIDGKSIDIADVMDAGKHKKDKLPIEAKASPADATIEWEPATAVENNFLKLEIGKKTFKIKVKKGSDSKEYTLNIERTETDAVLLKKLTIDGKSKEGAEIAEEMVFTVAQNASEVDVIAETDPENAEIVFEPSLTNGKLTLSGNETALKIKVGTAPKILTYTVKIKKLASPSAMFDKLFIYGGKKNGVDVEATNEQINQIMNSANIELELSGPEATILVASKTKKWKSFKVNGVAFNSFPYSSFVSVSIVDIKLLAKGETLNVKVEATDGTESAELNFKIKRNNDTVDVPVTKLYIRGENVLDKSETRLALHNGPIPTFEGAEPARVEIESNENVLKSITLDGTQYSNVNQKTLPDNEEAWSIEGSVTGVSPSGKDVILVVEPSDSENYHSITWNFHLSYKAAEPMKVEYEINGKDAQALESSFVQGLKNGTNPLIELESKFLNLKLACRGEVENIKINEKTIQQDNLVVVDTNYVLIHSISLDATEKQIEIVVNPSDTAVYSPVTFKFKAKGGNTTEKISPTFKEISGDKNLPKATFIDKLEGTDKPLYQTAKKTADIVIDLTEYECEFLCKEVKINDEKAEIKVTKNYLGSVYQIKKGFSVTDNAPTDVKIEFIANENKASDLIWTFQLQGGGTLPSLPQSLIGIFKINGKGSFSNPLPEEFTEHLIDGTKPIYTFDGNNALVEVGAYDDTLIEKVVFELDGIKKHEMAPQTANYASIAKYEFEIADTTEHDVKLIITPQDKTFSDLIYTFRLKWSGKKNPLPVIFGVEGVQQKTGYKATLNGEKAQLLVQARADIMLEVKIGEKNVSEEVCNITTFKGSSNKQIWQADKDVSLVDASGNLAEKTFVIRVKPKDANEYEETVFECILKGTKIEANNAEFVWTAGQNPRPMVYSTIKWATGLEKNGYIDEYGAEAVTLQAYTVSPRAKVKYQIIDLDGNAIEGKNVEEMTNTDGVHKSAEITLFNDKPTKIKAWVVAEDNSTTNSEKGSWSMVYNPVTLAWSYENKPNGGDYTTKAYDVIEFDKNAVGADKKIHLVYTVWKEDDGYTVLSDNLPEGQDAFVKLGAKGNLEEYYKTAIDVTKLINGEVPELAVTLKMKRNNVDCLTYNVKIKLKQ